ncbi:MAG: signal recognition particle-docking protein FtsY [Hydrotalea sp.]|nr:signal recognition particle-docking protein FtsY [Hydrotalea sp.]
MSFLSKLKTALKPSGGDLQQSIATSFAAAFKKSNKNWPAFVAALTDDLIMADVTPSLAKNIAEQLPRGVADATAATDELINIITKTIAPFEKKLDDLIAPQPANPPRVILMVGVNGTGKTTTLAKLAGLARDKNMSPLLIAGDSFRAAGATQLESWATKLGIACWGGAQQNSTDPAAIAHGGYNHALAHGHDIVFIDTAGRLHTNNNLMAELEKIVRVLKKINPDLPQDCLITLDATTGQNAAVQVEMFKKFTPINGIVITKMDGVAKGGIVLSILAQHHLPLYALGVGEQPADIDQFNAGDFVKSFFGR